MCTYIVRVFRPKGEHASCRMKERITALKVLVRTNRTQHMNAYAFNTHLCTYICMYIYKSCILHTTGIYNCTNVKQHFFVYSAFANLCSRLCKTPVMTWWGEQSSQYGFIFNCFVWLCLPNSLLPYKTVFPGL